jgi:hypothetical protein
MSYAEGEFFIGASSILSGVTRFFLGWLVLDGKAVIHFTTSSQDK